VSFSRYLRHHDAVLVPKERERKNGRKVERERESVGVCVCERDRDVALERVKQW